MTSRVRERRLFAAAFGYLVDQPIISVVTGLTTNPPLSNPLSVALDGRNRYTVAGRYGFCQRAGASGLAPSSVNPNFKNGYIEAYNLNVQQDLGRGAALQVGYIGSHRPSSSPEPLISISLSMLLLQRPTARGHTQRRRCWMVLRGRSAISPITTPLVCRITTRCG